MGPGEAMVASILEISEAVEMTEIKEFPVVSMVYTEVLGG